MKIENMQNPSLQNNYDGVYSKRVTRVTIEAKPEGRRMMATRKDVAKHAGVSVATVSYVVNQTKHVTPEVKARVEEAIRELHYTPNLVARSLVTRKTQHVAMLVNNLKNPYYTELLAGAQAVASKKGYIVSTIMIDYSNPEEGLQLAARGVDGAILATVQTEETAKMLEGSIPYATPTDNLVFSYKEGIFEAVKALKEHGHRDIAYLSGLHLNPERHVRYRNLLEALEFYDLPYQEELMVDGNSLEETDEEAGAHAVRKLLKRKVHFTAVLTLNDLMAFGAIRELNKKGLRVPEDISVIGCDNLEIGRYFVPSLSTLDVSSFEMGKYLMKTLIARIEKKSEPHKVVASSYIERESVGICRG